MSTEDYMEMLNHWFLFLKQLLQCILTNLNLIKKLANLISNMEIIYKIFKEPLQHANNLFLNT